MKRGNGPAKAKSIRWTPLALLLAGAALITLGIWRGEVTVVLVKAVNICLECIGIG